MDSIEFISEFISKTFGHPFVLLTLSLLLGRLFVLSQIIPSKVLDYKTSTVERILEMKNLVNETAFIYDRIVNTIKFKQADGVEFTSLKDDPVFMSGLTKDTDRLAILINEKIPLKLNNLSANIEIYFVNDENVKTNHQSYRKEIKRLGYFLAQKLPKDVRRLALNWNSFPELSFSEYDKLEKQLITSITKGKTIYKDMKS